MPTPRTSIWPRMLSGAFATGCASVAHQTHLIVGDQTGSIEGGRAAARQEQETQGQVGFAGPGGPAQQGGAPPERDAGAVNELQVRRAKQLRSLGRWQLRLPAGAR